MKIARTKENIKLTLSHEEWLRLGKVAGWNDSDVDPDLIGTDGFGNPEKPDSVKDPLALPEEDESDVFPGLGDEFESDYTDGEGLSDDGVPGQPPQQQSLEMGDTFLNNDPSAPPVDTDPVGADDVGLSDGSGDDGLGDEQLKPRPDIAGDYTMTTDGIDGMGQDVYYDGKGNLTFGGLGENQQPIPLDEVLRKHPGAKFKLHPVNEPDADIPEGSGSIGNAGSAPLDTSSAPF